MAIVHFVNYKRGTQSRAAMRGVMLYVMQEKKTAWEGAPLISGINCQPQSVYDDFLNTKLLYHKDGGVMFYHMVQSFPKGEAVDPRQAHEAARRLAEFFDGCEVLVCTHVDREHIHSHCIINSVNFDTGKKLHMAKEQLQELMRRNDAICQEMGLPVFDVPTQQARGMGGAEYHTALRGQSWKLRLMNTIDACMKYAADKDAFVSLMESEGYTVRWESSRKYITYTTPDGMRCRDNKLHEEKYCKEAMERNSRQTALPVQAPPPEASPTKADWGRMMNDLDTLWYHADRQTDLLERISRQMSQLPTRTQLDDLLKMVRHLEQMTEQAGKPKENSFSLHRIRLPRLHLPQVSIPALISLLMAAAALLLLWWGLGTVWSSSSLLSL